MNFNEDIITDTNWWRILIATSGRIQIKPTTPTPTHSVYTDINFESINSSVSVSSSALFTKVEFLDGKIVYDLKF